MRVLFSLFTCFCLMWATTASSQEAKIQEWEIAKLQAFGEKAGWTYKVGRSWVTNHLRQGGSLRSITGLVRPWNWRRGAKFVQIEADRDLPEAFDWREEVPRGLQPIRNQGSCGSCRQCSEELQHDASRFYQIYLQRSQHWTAW